MSSRRLSLSPRGVAGDSLRRAEPAAPSIDRAGNGEPFIGVMDAGQLRERLRALAGEG